MRQNSVSTTYLEVVGQVGQVGLGEVVQLPLEYRLADWRLRRLSPCHHHHRLPRHRGGFRRAQSLDELRRTPESIDHLRRFCSIGLRAIRRCHRWDQEQLRQQHHRWDLQGLGLGSRSRRIQDILDIQCRRSPFTKSDSWCWKTSIYLPSTISSPSTTPSTPVAPSVTFWRVNVVHERLQIAWMIPKQNTHHGHNHVHSPCLHGLVLRSLCLHGLVLSVQCPERIGWFARSAR